MYCLDLFIHTTFCYSSNNRQQQKHNRKLCDEKYFVCVCMSIRSTMDIEYMSIIYTQTICFVANCDVCYIGDVNIERTLSVSLSFLFGHTNTRTQESHTQNTYSSFVGEYIVMKNRIALPMYWSLWDFICFAFVLSLFGLEMPCCWFEIVSYVSHIRESNAEASYTNTLTPNERFRRFHCTPFYRLRHAYSNMERSL